MSDAAATWIIKIPQIFQPDAAEIISHFDGKIQKALGEEFYLIKSKNAPRVSAASMMIAWQMPVSHSWPCKPLAIDDFIEKSAQALWKKFADQKPQAIICGTWAGHHSASTYKKICIAMQQRCREIFSNKTYKAEEQSPQKNSLYCMIGAEGLFAGISSPEQANGFYAGGTKFMQQSISRAGAKIGEALHLLALHGAVPEQNAHWLELGASPGGMTAELLTQGYRVTAVDRAPLHESLMEHDALTFLLDDARTFYPYDEKYDALLCDMNGDAKQALQTVLRLTKNLRKNAPIIFTLKTFTTTHWHDYLQLKTECAALLKQHFIQLLDCKHLTYNRREFTLFMLKTA